MHFNWQSKLILVVMLQVLPGLGAVWAAASSGAYLLKDIKVVGLSRSDPAIIVTELAFAVGETITAQQVAEGINRIKNTALFSEVRGELVAVAGGYALVITAKDRWTTIPIVKFASGGGVSQLTLGVFDPNVAGKDLELGGQMERLGETNSGVAWFKNRRVAGSHLGLDIQYWQISRLRTKYVPEAIGKTIKTGFLHSRRKVYLGLRYEWLWWLSSDIYFESHRDSFSDRYVSAEVQQQQLLATLPPNTSVLFYGGRLVFGRIDQDSYLQDGVALTVDHRRGGAQQQGVRSFEQTEFVLRAFKTLPGQITIGERLTGGNTNTNVLQYWYYLGGLDGIRGFADNRFAGRYYWLSNSELRVPVWQTSQLVVQNVAFYDVVATGEALAHLASARGASVGIGVRFIAPKIYRLVARVDYAQPVLRRDDSHLSFGVQQFF